MLCYEKSNIMRFSMALTSLFYNYNGNTENTQMNRTLLTQYQQYSKLNGNPLDTAHRFFEETGLFTYSFDANILPKIKFILLLDSAREHKYYQDMLKSPFVDIFVDFVQTYNIPQHAIYFAKQNYKSPIMRNISFGNCDTDFMTWIDDDDLYGISIFEKYKLIQDNTTDINPLTTPVRISFTNTLKIIPNSQISCLNTTILAQWSKVYSKKLCENACHIPSVSGGEDAMTNKHLIADIKKVVNNFKDITITPPLKQYSYIWIQSKRAKADGRIQRKFIDLYRNRYNPILNKMIRDTPRQLQKYVSTIQSNYPSDKKDVVWHEDSVIGLYYADNDTVGELYMFVCQRPIGAPQRRVEHVIIVSAYYVI